MGLYLVDANHLSNGVGKVSRFRDQVRQRHRKGDRFNTCWTVLFELEAGIVSTSNPHGCRRHLKSMLKEIKLRPLDWQLMLVFGELNQRLRKQGRALSSVDKILAAMALSYGATLLTTDQDFLAIPELRTENWLA